MAYVPLDPRLRSDPYPIYRAIRAHDPVQHNTEHGVWTVLGHAECASVLRDPAFSSARAQRHRQRQSTLPPSMLNVDPPEHSRLRRPFQHALAGVDWTIPMAEVSAFAADRLAELSADADPIDLMARFVRPVATYAVVRALGLPTADIAPLARLLAEATANLDPFAPPDLQARGAVGATNLRAYGRGQIRRRRSRPSDDTLAGLVAAADAAGLADAELLATFNLVLIGGHDPTVHALGNAIHALIRNPAQAQRLAANPALMPDAVEELLRYDSPVQLASRIASRELRLGTGLVHEGETVVVVIGAANRDPTVFADPDELDIGRRPNPQLAFGLGPHYCLGAAMVREILLAVLPVIAPALIDAQIVEPVGWSERVIPRGLTTLPVRLRPGRASRPEPV
jgi:cytochrome P450